MELSRGERLLVQCMRDGVQAEVKQLKERLERSEKSRYDITSEYRYLKAWNSDLISALDEHDILVPGLPGSQYPGTPSDTAYE